MLLFGVRTICILWGSLLVAFYRRGLAETTLKLIGIFLMAGPTTARVALRLAGMTYGWPYDSYSRTIQTDGARGMSRTMLRVG